MNSEPSSGASSPSGSHAVSTAAGRQTANRRRIRSALALSIAVGVAPFELEPAGLAATQRALAQGTPGGQAAQSPSESAQGPASAPLRDRTRGSTTPYDADADHPANRVFRAAYVVATTPKTVGAVLPEEHGREPGFFVKRWYFGKRPGTDRDTAIYGGDGRQMPREGFSPAESEALAQALAELDGEVLDRIRAEPRIAIFLQHDILRLARRLLTTERNPELLPALRAAGERLALPAATLRNDQLGTFALTDLTDELGDLEVADLIEVDRKSTRLFHAGFTQLWSKIFVGVPQESGNGAEALLAALASGDGDSLPTVPVGTTAVLVQGITALDEGGKARATPVVIDLRIHRLANREPLSGDNPTATRDGGDFVQRFLTRATVRSRAGQAIDLSAFDSIPMATPELFRDYGSLKLTTYAGQCSLCHRRTHTASPELGGFRVLSPPAKPRPAEPDARLRLAERQLAGFLAQLPR